MTKPRTLRRRESGSDDPRGLGSAPGTLPPDLVEKAGKRLSLAALTYAIVYALAYGSGRVSSSFADYWDSMAGVYVSDVIAAGFILFSVVVFFVVRSGRFAPALLLDLGLVYEVVGAIGIDVHLALGHWTEGMQATGLSWVAVWIVFFPLIVPSTSGKTLLASLATATTTPVLYAIGLARGAPPITGAVAAVVVPNYLCVGLAIVAARVVYRLGADVGRARRMGSYQLTERLGMGGMGEVWRAEHRLLARPAAIKLIRPDPGDSDAGRTPSSHYHRFEREVQATALLRSPHTVEVYDYGTTQDRTFYYVMELLDGLSLEDLVKQYGPVPPERAIHILRQMCHSLAEAHATGLVHRDIKPANVFVCRYGLEHDFVKVLDFGVVKRAGPETTQDVKLTDVGSFAGTPAYASPESALGEGQLDGRSDIYAVGCVAFWLLTGRTVFQAGSPMLMLVRHVNEAPPAPSTCSEFDVPPALDRLVLDCLQKDKAGRPPSIRELDRRLAGIETFGHWDTARRHRWWDRHLPRRPTHELDVLDSHGALAVVVPVEGGADD
jgi:serine/threonine-protein kinase